MAEMINANFIISENGNLSVKKEMTKPSASEKREEMMPQIESIMPYSLGLYM